MELGTLFFLLLVLACPLMMVWMMRGHAGHHGHGSHSARSDDRVVAEAGTLAELRHRRDAIDAEIERLEGSEPKTPAGV